MFGQFGTQKERNFYNEAKSNDEFKKHLSEHEPDFVEPKIWWCIEKKGLYNAIYMGWLIARGEYDEENYE